MQPILSPVNFFWQKRLTTPLTLAIFSRIYDSQLFVILSSFKSRKFKERMTLSDSHHSFYLFIASKCPLRQQFCGPSKFRSLKILSRNLGIEGQPHENDATMTDGLLCAPLFISYESYSLFRRFSAGCFKSGSSIFNQ